MSIEFFIALRYLKARRRGVFTLLTTFIAVGGITLGVAALIITLAVMTGFQRDIREKILGIQPHIMITKESSIPFTEYAGVGKEIAKNKNVKAVSPYVMSQAILRHGQLSQGVLLKGIDYESEDRVVDISGIIVSRKEKMSLGDNEILLGTELAHNLSARNGDEVIVMSQGQMAMVPRMEKFKVKKLFHCGMYEFDSNLAFISLGAAEKLFQMGSAASGLDVSVKNWEKADMVEKELQEEISYPYWVPFLVQDEQKLIRGA